jgi:hypothetical protein
MAQTWVRERDTGVYRLDIFREPHDGDTWIRRPKDQADFTGVLPLLNPARRAWLAATLARVHPRAPMDQRTTRTSMSIRRDAS